MYCQKEFQTSDWRKFWQPKTGPFFSTRNILLNQNVDSDENSYSNNIQTFHHIFLNTRSATSQNV